MRGSSNFLLRSVIWLKTEERYRHLKLVNAISNHFLHSSLGEMTDTRMVAFEGEPITNLPKMIMFERQILENFDHYWKLAKE